MITLSNLLRPTIVARAHCDIPCGIYDPEQARIEAESCYRIIEKYHASNDPVFRARCIYVKEQRAELVKQLLDILWHDYFKPGHLDQYPTLHQTFWTATKQASKVRWSLDLALAAELLTMYRRDRRDLEGHGRPREHARQLPADLTHARLETKWVSASRAAWPDQEFMTFDNWE